MLLDHMIFDVIARTFRTIWERLIESVISELDFSRETARFTSDF